MCTNNICPFIKWVFFTINVFLQTSQLPFYVMFNEHVEMNKFTQLV